MSLLLLLAGSSSPSYPELSTLIADFNTATDGYSDTGATTPATLDGTLRSVRSSSGSLIAVASANCKLRSIFGKLTCDQTAVKWVVSGAGIDRRDFVMWIVSDEKLHYTTSALAQIGNTSNLLFHGIANIGTIFNGSQSNSLPKLSLERSIIKLVSGASSTQISMDGTPLASSTSAFTSGTATDVEFAGSTDYPWAGRWNRVIIASPAPTSDEIAAMDAYLAVVYPSTTIPLSTTAVILHGNSFIEGLNVAYGNEISTLLQTQLGSGYQTRNAGLGGQATPTMISSAPIDVDPFYSGSRSRNVLIGWDVTNHISSGADAATVLASYQTYRTARETVFGQANVIMCDCLLRGSWNGTQVGYKDSVNASLAAEYTTATSSPYIWKKSGGGMLYRASLYFTDATINTWSPVDNLHPNEAANAIIAGHLKDAILL